MSTNKICLQCGQDIKGRSDKKFCDDQCRSHHNREHSFPDERYVRKVLRALKKNRQILMDLNPGGKTKVLCKTMLKNGFDFSYFTSVLKTAEGKYYYFCFEMGYILISKEHALLVKKEDHTRMQAGN